MSPFQDANTATLIPVWEAQETVGARSAFPTVKFDDASSRLVIGVEMERVDWWEEHAVDVYGAAGVCAALGMVWLVVRAFGRVRVPGRWYCRTCNYDVTAVGCTEGRAAPACVERCSECGSATSVERPVRGRAIRGRIVAPLVCAVCVVAMIVGAWRELRPFRGARAWPFEIVGRIAPW